MRIRYLDGNCLQLLINGRDYFPVQITAIHAASDEIYLKSYIFADDQTGRGIAGELAMAGRRGVTASALSKEMFRELREKMVAGGVQEHFRAF